MFKKITYWFTTGILLLFLAMAVSSYLMNYDQMAQFFAAFNYPTYLVYPLAALKAIAILVIVTHRYNDLRDMVYAAYFFNMIMALTAHLLHGDPAIHAIIGTICLPIWYLLGNQVRGRPKRTFFGKWTNPQNVN